MIHAAEKQTSGSGLPNVPDGSGGVAGVSGAARPSSILYLRLTLLG